MTLMRVTLLNIGFVNNTDWEETLGAEAKESVADLGEIEGSDYS